MEIQQNTFAPSRFKRKPKKVLKKSESNKTHLLYLDLMKILQGKHPKEKGGIVENEIYIYIYMCVCVCVYQLNPSAPLRLKPNTKPSLKEYPKNHQKKLQ
eukprot:TRINITY_DN7225_c0_g2_i3.p1 TRINITY_DN7225_c0_g2~~TRINITY_DN7225_c0_g2_i3.p1  ORF type:complete len:100 (+),score=1.43 TRINITY_DN7225_c0_g2_i3:181-480(+)